VAVLLLATACAKGATSSAPVATLSTTTPPTFTPSSAARLRPSATATSAEVPTWAPTGDKSDEAAIQTARAFVWASHEASVTQDMKYLEPFTDPSCPCLRVVSDAIREQRNAHARLETEPLIDVRAVITERSARAIVLRIQLTVPAARVLGRAGNVIESDPAARQETRMTLEFQGQSWRVTRNEKV
jgi:hypothetical protein